MSKAVFAPVSRAWLDYESAMAEDTLDAAYRELLQDSAWAEWFAEHILPDGTPNAPFHYMQFDDRAKRRIVVTGENVSLYEPASNAQAAEDRGELQSYFVGLLEMFFTRYAEKTGRRATPSSILGE